MCFIRIILNRLGYNSKTEAIQRQDYFRINRSVVGHSHPQFPISESSDRVLTCIGTSQPSKFIKKCAYKLNDKQFISLAWLYKDDNARTLCVVNKDSGFKSLSDKVYLDFPNFIKNNPKMKFLIFHLDKQKANSTIPRMDSLKKELEFLKSINKVSQEAFIEQVEDQIFIIDVRFGYEIYDPEFHEKMLNFLGSLDITIENFYDADFINNAETHLIFQDRLESKDISDISLRKDIPTKNDTSFNSLKSLKVNNFNDDYHN